MGFDFAWNEPRPRGERPKPHLVPCPARMLQRRSLAPAPCRAPQHVAGHVRAPADDQGHQRHRCAVQAKAVRAQHPQPAARSAQLLQGRWRGAHAGIVARARVHHEPPGLVAARRRPAPYLVPHGHLPVRHLRQVQERQPGELPRRARGGMEGRGAQPLAAAVPRLLRCGGREGGVRYSFADLDGVSWLDRPAPKARPRRR